jgi:ligand-binding sensor domain-containing protein
MRVPLPSRIARHRLVWVLLAAAAGIAGYSLFRAQQALSSARSSLAEASEVRFQSLSLDRSLPSGFEPIGSAPSYNDAARFQGRLYLAGAGGLTRLDPDGKPDAEFRPGLELPSSPLTALAIGLAADSAEPELWIATASEGLLAYNGRAFRHIRPENPAARKVTSLAVIGNGRIAFGTDRLGVLVYDGKHIGWLHPSLRDLRVTTLAGDETSLWVGTADQGLIHLRAGELQRYTEPEGLPDAHVTALAISDDQAFAGTPAGVVEFNGSRLIRQLAPGAFVRSLALQDNRLMIGTLEDGVLDLPLTTTSRRPGTTPSQSLDGEIRRIVSNDEPLLVLTPDAAYQLGVRNRWQRITPQDEGKLTDRNVSALHVDPDARLWIGYFDRGLDVTDPTGHTTHIEDDHVFCVNRIVRDPSRQATAVATANGLVYFDSALRQREVLGRTEGLIANHVTDLAAIPGGLAVATPAGITLLDAAGPRSLYAFHGLVNNHVYAIATEGTRLLAGTLGGLSILDSGEVRASFTTANSGLKQNWITAIVRAGDEWFLGTYGAGVLRLDANGRWTALPERSGAFVVNPNAMLATEDAVYAGTLDRGLAIYHRAAGRWTLVTRGLPSANVTAITRSGGMILIGTDNGLVRVPEGNLLL